MDPGRVPAFQGSDAHLHRRPPVLDGDAPRALCHNGRRRRTPPSTRTPKTSSLHRLLAGHRSPESLLTDDILAAAGCASSSALHAAALRDAMPVCTSPRAVWQQVPATTVRLRPRRRRRCGDRRDGRALGDPSIAHSRSGRRSCGRQVLERSVSLVTGAAVPARTRGQRAHRQRRLLPPQREAVAAAPPAVRDARAACAGGLGASVAGRGPSHGRRWRWRGRRGRRCDRRVRRRRRVGVGAEVVAFGHLLFETQQGAALGQELSHWRHA